MSFESTTNDKNFTDFAPHLDLGMIMTLVVNENI